MRILFIGNSFTGRNDLPGLLSAMAASVPESITIETDSVLANGASLRQHWNAGLAAEKVGQGRWDYVVLQEQSTLPIKNAGRFHENVRLFNEIIRQQGAKTVLYLTWARQNAPETQPVLNEATRSIAGEIGALVAPAGVIWQNARQSHPDLELYDKDGSHPSPTGSYLAACVFYTTLLQKNPVGLLVPERLRIDQATVTLVQQVAWQTKTGVA
jgi:hypothetical protein